MNQFIRLTRDIRQCSNMIIFGMQIFDVVYSDQLCLGLPVANISPSSIVHTNIEPSIGKSQAEALLTGYNQFECIFSTQLFNGLSLVCTVHKRNTGFLWTLKFWGVMWCFETSP